jgi:nitrite reductase/ring-hydroxylating ferredoxin subunit
VAADGELPRNGMKAFVVAGVRVLVVHTGERIVAVQGLCPHEAVPLEHGLVKGATLTCLEHMWRFDVETGQPLDAAEEGLRTYDVKHQDGALYVAL